MKNKDAPGQNCQTTIKIDETYHSALKRNLNEVVIAKLEFEAYREIGNKVLLNFPNSFFWLSGTALFNDMMAHMIKVFDRDAQSATFWYIFRCKSKDIKKFIKENNIDFMSIYDFAEKLKQVRDKTHFHIDKKGVKNPAGIWKSADISYNELKANIDAVYKILNYLHVNEFEFDFLIPKIDDLQYIIKAAIDAEYITKK
mgnify:CR=1 FL=1